MKPHSTLRARFLVLAASTVCTLSTLPAEPVTPAPGTKDRQTLMDTLRQMAVVQAHAKQTGEEVVFRVHALWVDGDVALAEVSPMTRGGAKTFPRQLAFLRRGGDEPWDTVEVGAPDQAKNGWAAAFLAKPGNETYHGVWKAYLAAAVKAPEAESPGSSPSSSGAGGGIIGPELEKQLPITSAVMAQDFMKEMKEDLKKPILLEDVKVVQEGGWAWFEGSPYTQDRTWQGERLLFLLRLGKKGWEVVTGIPDEVVTADNAEKAYQQWRAGLLKKYPTLPARIVPAQ